MPLYPPDGHDLLSDEAASISSDALAAQAELAEDFLGLDGTSFTGDDADRATRAVALQVSHQVARPQEFTFAESESRGQQSVTYRGKGEALLDERAKRVAERLIRGRAHDRRQPSTTATADFRHEFPVT